MRKKTPNGGFSEPIVVADKMAEGISCKTQSSGIAANGDYISLAVLKLNDGLGTIDVKVYKMWLE